MRQDFGKVLGAIGLCPQYFLAFSPSCFPPNPPPTPLICHLLHGTLFSHHPSFLTSHPHIYPLFSSTKPFLRSCVLAFSRSCALALLCSPCPRSAQYFLHNKSALTSHCTTAHSPALSYKTTVHKSAPTPLHALRSLRKHPPLSPYISIFFSTSIHFHTVQIKYFLHFSTFLAFLRSCILPAIHALTPHICYPHYRFPARILFLHSRVVPLCCTHALYALYRATETYHLGDTILHIPRWFPSTIPDLPMSSCISSTSNGITLLILSDTTLVILFLAFLHSCVLAPTRFVRTVFLHVLMNFYGILSYLSLFLPAFTLLRRHTSTFVLYMRRKAPAPAVS